MERRSRAFKLKLSPAGIDLLIDCHCRLIRTTRALLPYGTTLHVALHHLADIPEKELLADLRDLPGCNLSGAHTFFVGAPKYMAEVAAHILSRLTQAAPNELAPTISQIYLVSLQRLKTARSGELLGAVERLGKSIPGHGIP